MRKPTRARGFSLLELLVAMAIMLVISASAFSLLASYQKYYTSTVLKADVHSGLRNSTELLQQEIGQAGLVSLTPTTLSAAVAAGTQTVAVGSATGMFVGEKLKVDLGSNQESVAITDCGSPCSGGTGTVAGGSIKGVFANAHSAGAPVYAVGIFPQGILSTSTANQLNMFGDVNADGSIVFVQYNCDYTAGQLTRSVTPITAGAKSTAVVLLDNLVANPAPPAGTSPPCFQYPATRTITTTAGTTYNFIPGVGVTLTTQTTELDPNTRTYAQETKSFLNLAPRNILLGISMASGNLDQYLQPNPSSCLLLGTC